METGGFRGSSCVQFYILHTSGTPHVENKISIRNIQFFKNFNKTYLGSFQLEFVSISRVINHMTCYKSSALIGWKYSIQTGEQIL